MTSEPRKRGRTVPSPARRPGSSKTGSGPDEVARDYWCGRSGRNSRGLELSRDEGARLVV